MSDINIKKSISKSGKIGILVVIACVLITIASVVTVFCVLKDGDEQQSKKKRNVVVNSENVQQVVENLKNEEQVAAGNYDVKMNSEWVFKDGSSISENAYVENVVTNTHDVYFDVILSDTNETIMESPVLTVGSHLENIALDVVLEKGTYDCKVIYHLIDEDQNTISTLKIALTIIVEN